MQKEFVQWLIFMSIHVPILIYILHYIRFIYDRLGLLCIKSFTNLTYACIYM